MHVDASENMKWVLEHCAVPGGSYSKDLSCSDLRSDIADDSSTGAVQAVENTNAATTGIFNIFICAGDLSSELDNVICVFKFLVANYDAVFQYNFVFVLYQQ